MAGKGEPPAGGVEELDGPRATLIRRSVLDMATQLFAEHGYGGTSLLDVASALGMSRTAIYYYFSSKEKMLEALVEEVTFSSERQSSAIADREDLEPEDALRLVARTHARWLLEHGLQFRVIDRTDSELPPHLRERHQQSKRTVLDNFTRVIERGVEHGRFRPVDPRNAAFAIIGMCSWTAWWFKPDGRSSVAEVADLIGDMGADSLLRTDAHRDRSNNPADALRILKEDLEHLERLIPGLSPAAF
jgi:AcrR family transcriptional regulator